MGSEANDVCKAVGRVLDELKLPWEQRQRFVAACDLQCAGGPCYPSCLPAAPPPLQEAHGMKPGQRCTYASGHELRGAPSHAFDPGNERQWETNRFLRDEKRCPYVAGALQEAPTCDGSGYVHNPETHNGQKRCPGCPACAPPATEPCPCGEGGNPLHVFVHPAPKEPRHE